MAKENLFLKKAHEMGLIDERELCVAANVVCSNGNRGRAWVFIDRSNLYLYELMGFADMGECIEVLDLSKARFLKGSSFILNPNMKLEYAGYTYKFTGFPQTKRIIAAVQEACKG